MSSVNSKTKDNKRTFVYQKNVTSRKWFRKEYLSLYITASGVLIALFIGAMQVYIASQQNAIAKRQSQIASTQGEIQVISSWIPFLKDENPEVRYTAISALERIDSDATIAPLISALSDNEALIRNKAAQALGKHKSPAMLETIIGILNYQDAKTREAAINTLVLIGYDRLPEILEALSKFDPKIQAIGQKAVVKIILNEKVLQKIGASGSKLLVQGSEKITLAIIGGGIDKSFPEIKDALIGEFNYVKDTAPDNYSSLIALLCVGNPDNEIVGIAHGIKIISERVITIQGGGETGHVIKAVEHAAKQGAKIICILVGGGAPDPELQKAINTVHNLGCIVIVPVGNSNEEIKTYPAGYENVIAVAATNIYDQKHAHSNYGDWIDISAPGSPLEGSDVKSQWNMTGSVFSAGLVAAAFALVWSVDPSLDGRTIEEIILSNADPIDKLNPKYRNKLGSGRLNIIKSITELKKRLNTN